MRVGVGLGRRAYFPFDWRVLFENWPFSKILFLVDSLVVETPLRKISLNYVDIDLVKLDMWRGLTIKHHATTISSPLMLRDSGSGLILLSELTKAKKEQGAQFKLEKGLILNNNTKNLIQILSFLEFFFTISWIISSFYFILAAIDSNDAKSKIIISVFSLLLSLFILRILQLWLVRKSYLDVV
jgi:hypothetical protein